MNTRIGEKENMIWLASYPRSGNKFVQQILHHVYGHAIRTMYEVPSGVWEIAPTWDGNMEFEGFVKTHDPPWPECDLRSVYIVRDPRDVICSQVTYLRHTDKDLQNYSMDEIVQHILISKPYGGWNRNCSKWANKASAVLKYEECLIDPIGELGRVCRLLQLSDTIKGELPEFSGLQESADWYYQKGSSGRWKTELSPELVSLVEFQNSEMMLEMGYSKQ
jgi:hypothetical protein